MAGILAGKGKRVVTLLAVGLVMGIIGTSAHSESGKTAQPWDMGPGEFLSSEDLGHGSQVASLAFTFDGKMLVSTDTNRMIVRWAISRRQRIGFLAGLGRTLSISSDGKLATSTGNSKVSTWELAMAKKTGSITVQSEDARLAKLLRNSLETKVLAASLSPDGRKLFTVDFSDWCTLGDKDIEVINRSQVIHWDTVTGKQNRTWTVMEQRYPLGRGASHVADIASADVTRDGKTVVAALDSGAIKLYELESGRERVLRSGEQTEGGLMNSFREDGLSLSPDNRMLASWKKVPTAPADGLPFPDVKVLLKLERKLAARRNAPITPIRIWELLTGKETVIIPGHQFEAGAIAWSPDCRLVASGDQRSKLEEPAGSPTIGLWDAITGKEMGRSSELDADVTALTFTPDGSSLVAGLEDGSVLIWKLAKMISGPRVNRRLAGEELDSCWSDLFGEDAGKAYRAIGMLVDDENESVPFLRHRLKPVPLVDAAKVDQWIVDLGGDKFAVHQAARKNLEEAGDQIQARIQKALKASNSLEARMRLEGVLHTLRMETLRTIRAMMVLERIGSPEAQGILMTLSRGQPGAHETEEAKGSLERLRQRVSRSP